jgi:hypothetical protein
LESTVEIASNSAGSRASQWKWQEIKLEPKDTGPESTNKGLDREGVTEKRERTLASAKFRRSYRLFCVAAAGGERLAMEG